MALIKCPNCGRNTFDDYKCSWCKYPLREKAHSFDAEKYRLIKAEYVNNPEKIKIIRLCVEKYGLGLDESREIVNHIVEAEYDKNNYRSYEEINCANEDAVYNFSFVQYFARNFVYKIIIAVLIFRGARLCPTPNIAVLLLILLLCWCIFSLYQLIKAATWRFLFEAGRIEYSYQASNFSSIGGGKRFEAMSAGGQFEERMSKHNIYEIDRITDVRETFGHIYVKGDIKHVVIRFRSNGTYRKTEKKLMNEIRISKYFSGNSEIVRKLYGRVKRKKSNTDNGIGG